MRQQPNQSVEPLSTPIDSNSLAVDNQLRRVADILRMLGEPTRLRILILLKQQGELCVTDIYSQLQISQHDASIRLRKLYHWQLVSFRREGQRLYYQLTDTALISEPALARLFHSSTGKKR